MTKLPLGLVIGGVASLLAGIALTQPALGFLGVLLFSVGAAIHMQSRLRSRGVDADEAGLSPDSRAQLAPFRRHLRELERYVAANPENPVVKVLGQEAFEQAQELKRNAAEALRVRRQLLLALAGKSGAQRARALADQSGDTESRERRSEELARYDAMDLQVDQLEADLRQAESQLAELVAQLKGDSLAFRTDGQTDALRERISQLKSISASFDEAQSLLDRSS